MTNVLVPFYRGAVVFVRKWSEYGTRVKFSSPFIEERLYLKLELNMVQQLQCSRPLLSRSGCIYKLIDVSGYIGSVLVPFYRGAVVFTSQL